MWKRSISWDEQLQPQLQKTQSSFRNRLQHFTELRIPRYIFFEIHRTTDILHAFADAAEQAFGMCVYLRPENAAVYDNVTLLCTKSRVAPTKSTSLPRLELCATLLMVQLVQRILQINNLPISSIHYWTDSTVVLSWIAAPSYSWKNFVANKVAQMQEHTQLKQWHHMRSENNPADLISRGTSRGYLRNSTR